MLFSEARTLIGRPIRLMNPKRVLLVVARAHREAGDIQAVKRIRALAADRLQIAFEQAHRDFARDRFGDLFKECIQRFAQAE